jgi:SAM-dependent methyltransferase
VAPNVSEQPTGWVEDNSEFFIDLGEVITPSRAEQMFMAASLVPAQESERFVAVDLACGAGLLSATLLRRFPECRVIALDGSPRMLEESRKNLAQFGACFELGLFDLKKRDWLESLPNRVRCFVSSLAVHHLDAAEKQQLFRDLRGKLEPGGALIIVDLVEAANDWARRACAHAWDAAVREQALRLNGNLAAYARFREGWNHYVTPDIDFDKPSRLFEQLQWLAEAGFSQVDCFWLKAGHAIYGGYVEPFAVGH